VSRCLGFEACRYDARVLQSDVVARLEPHVRFVPVCPELEIGMGVPRDPIRIVTAPGVHRLLQPETGSDLGPAMESFARDYLDGLARTGVDGFVLKSRSPSCGVGTTKIFPDTETEEHVALGSGFFAAAVLARFPGAAVADEVQLADRSARAGFLERLFRNAAMREGKAPPGPSWLEKLSKGI